MASWAHALVVHSSPCAQQPEGRERSEVRYRQGLRCDSWELVVPEPVLEPEGWSASWAGVPPVLSALEGAGPMAEARIEGTLTGCMVISTGDLTAPATSDGMEWATGCPDPFGALSGLHRVQKRSAPCTGR